MTKVNFEIHLILNNDIQEISEQTLSQEFDQYRDLLCQQEVLEGVITIEVEGQPPLQIQDELWSAVQNLCFSCIPSLLEDKNKCYLYRCTNSDSHIVMIPLSNLVRIIGEDTPTVTDTIHTLFPELFKCGVRFLEFLECLGENERATAQYLQQFADKAHSILHNYQLYKSC